MRVTSFLILISMVSMGISQKFRSFCCGSSVNAKSSSIVVVKRKEIRSLNSWEQYRFIKAIKTMIKRDDFNAIIRAYKDYEKLETTDFDCAEGIYKLAPWNRLLLKDFENSLQQADTLNGYNGKIGLPYWDWMDLNEIEIIPHFIKKVCN